MTRILLLDLGDTLVRGNEVLPHVHEALTALAEFRTEDGRKLAVALVSDFDRPSPPPSAVKIKVIFDQYVSLLEKLGLRKFFEPVRKHVTLSTQAGVKKPDPKIFTLALKHLGVSADLADCIFVTENAAHVAYCREQLGMSALQFGVDFHDWSEALVLLAPIVAPSGMNHALALEAFGRVHGLEGFSSVEPRPGFPLKGQAQRWVAVTGADLGEAAGAFVRLPVQVEVTKGTEGKLATNVSEPSEGDIAEATSYVRGLVARGDIGPTATHELVRDASGRRLLRRRGFTGSS